MLLHSYKLVFWLADLFGIPFLYFIYYYSIWFDFPHSNIRFIQCVNMDELTIWAVQLVQRPPCCFFPPLLLVFQMRETHQYLAAELFSVQSHQIAPNDSCPSPNKATTRRIMQKSQTQIFRIIFSKAVKGSKVQRMLQRGGHGGTFSSGANIWYFKWHSLSFRTSIREPRRKCEDTKFSMELCIFCYDYTWLCVFT